MKITIESGIKIPTKFRSGIAQAMRSMKKGDSFVFNTEGVASRVNNIHGSARNIGIKIASRKIDNNGTYRVWRIA